MNGIKLKVSVGLLTALVLIAVFLSYDILSNNPSHDVKTNAAEAQQRMSSPSSKGENTDSLTPNPSSGPASSVVSSALTLTEKLNNPVVKNASKLKNSIYSPNAILVSVDDKTILMDKNAGKKIYPASMTKIMTAIVAIEEIPDLQQTVCIPKQVIDQMNAQDASMAGFGADENVRAIDLLYGAILPSGAECCIGLANYLEGSEQNFVNKMNEKAAALGLKNTHFMNTTGLHDPNHYTTGKDLSVLLCYALQNDTFRRIFTTPSYTSAATNKHSDGVSFRSTMFRNLDSPTVGKTKILGGKVGYTDEAGLCLASLAEKGGKEYILVTAGAKNCYKAEIKDAVTVYGSLG